MRNGFDVSNPTNSSQLGFTILILVALFAYHRLNLWRLSSGRLWRVAYIEYFQLGEINKQINANQKDITAKKKVSSRSILGGYLLQSHYY
jgi:hypothetical protein